MSVFSRNCCEGGINLIGFLCSERTSNWPGAGWRRESLFTDMLIVANLFRTCTGISLAELPALLALSGEVSASQSFDQSSTLCPPPHWMVWGSGLHVGIPYNVSKSKRKKNPTVAAKAWYFAPPYYGIKWRGSHRMSWRRCGYLSGAPWLAVLNGAVLSSTDESIPHNREDPYNRSRQIARMP